MTPPVVGPDGALSAELRERLVELVEAAGPTYCLPTPSANDIVDAIVAELARAGWRDLAAVRDADQAQANMGGEA